MKTNTILSPLSRILTSAIFISAGINKLRNPKQTLQYMKSKNMPMPPVMLAGAIGMELGVGTALLLGYRSRTAAGLLAGFLVPTSLVFHDFWKADGQERELQTINFFKNVAIIGGLLKTVRHGGSELSLDALREGHRLIEEVISSTQSDAGSPVPNEVLRHAAA